MSDRRTEIVRKTIHVGASLIAAGVLLALGHPAGAVVLAGAALVALLIEVARQLSPTAAAAFGSAVGPLLRPAEHGRITGATTLALGCAIAAAAFPVTEAVAGILFAGLADAAAAVIGRRWGRVRYAGGKSLEGSGAFFGCVLLITMAVAGTGVAAAALVALVLTLIEAIRLPIDDNLYLPVAGAAVLAAVGQAGPLQIFS